MRCVRPEGAAACLTRKQVLIYDKFVRSSTQQLNSQSDNLSPGIIFAAWGLVMTVARW